MKISYIILPFENPEYLIRCINSLYRQIGSDYEVVLAENDFGEGSDELKLFLDEKRQLIRITQNAKSREEKLAEAAGLINADSCYVMLVDVNTVVAPIAAQMILSCGKPDIIIPVAAVRNEKGFLLGDADEIAFIEKIEQCTPDRICFNRRMFTKFYKEISLDTEKNFHYWMLEKCAENLNIGCTKNVCIYTENILEKKIDRIEIGQWKIVVAKAAENFENIGNIKLKFGLVNKYVTDFIHIMGEDIEDTEDIASIFAEFQNLCGKCMDSPLLSKLLKQRVGVQAGDFLRFSWEEYRLYLNLFQTDSSSVLIDNPVIQNEPLYEMEKKLEDLLREVTSIKMESAVNAGVSTDYAIIDPLSDIPQLYRDGRLGFRTIMGSFMGWIGYKLRKK